MKEQPHKGGSRLGWRRGGRWLFWLLVLLLGAYAASNAVLWTPWMRRWLAGQAETRIHLPVKVGIGSWSPWNGISLRNLEVSPPPEAGMDGKQPLLHIEKVSLRPAWGLLLRGRVELHEVRFEAPRAMVPWQLLAYLVSRGDEVEFPASAGHETDLASAPPDPSLPPETVQQTIPPAHSGEEIAAVLETERTPPSAAGGSAGPLPLPEERPSASPDLAAAREPAPAAGSGGPPGTPSPERAGEAAATVGEGLPPAGLPPSATASARQEQEAAPAVPERPPSARPPSQPVAAAPHRTWVHITRGSLEVVAGGENEPLLRVEGLEGRIPVSGAPIASRVRVGWIQLFGEKLSGWDIPIRWEPGGMELGPCATTVFGIDLEWQGRFLPAKALPLQVECRVPRQHGVTAALPRGATAEIGTLAAEGRFLGALLLPGSWQGAWLAKADGIALTQQERQAHFDHGQVVVQLRGPVVMCTDARLIGDEFSLLGNAMVAGDGRTAAVMRVAAEPETVQNVVGEVLPGLEEFSFTPLRSTERVGFDLELRGAPGDWDLRLGKDGPLMDLPVPGHSP